MATIIKLSPHLFPSEFREDFTNDLTLTHTPDHFSTKRFITYRFGCYPGSKKRRELLFWIIEAFKSWAAAKAGATRKERYQHLKLFFKFLNENNSQITTLKAITCHTIDQFESWLKARTRKTKKENTHDKAWKAINSMFREIRSRRPELLDPEVSPRRISFRTSNRSPTQAFRPAKKILTKEQIRDVERACRTKIELYRTTWLRGRQLIAEAALAGYDGRIIPDENTHLGYALTYLKHHWLATGRRAREESGQRLRLIEKRPTFLRRFNIDGSDGFYRYFLPRHEDLFPSILLVLSRTGGNPTDIFNLSRNCLTGEPGTTKKERGLQTLLTAVDDTPRRIHFLKSKTGKWQSRQYDRNSYSPVVLVEHALQMTELTHSHAHGAAEDKLWVFEGMPRGVIRWPREMSFSYQLRRFLRENNISGITPRLFRNTFLNAVVVETEDITAAQAVAGHSSPDTIRNDYLAGPGRTKLREAIAKIQMSMTKWVQKGTAPKAKDLEVSFVRDGSPVDAAVQLWLAMFIDHRLIFEGSVEKATRLLQLRHHINASRRHIHASRWELGFAQLLTICDDLISRFRTDVIERARQLVETFQLSNPLPPIE